MEPTPTSSIDIPKQTFRTTKRYSKYSKSFPESDDTEKNTTDTEEIENENENIDETVSDVYDKIKKRLMEKLTKKYCITLKLVNEILKNCDRPEINELTNFKHIDRHEIIDKKNTQILEKMLPEIQEYFGKKPKTDEYILTILRNMCKQLTLHFKQKYKNVQKNGHVTSYVLYSIVYDDSE